MGSNLDEYIAEVKASHFIEATILDRIVKATNKAHDPIIATYPPEGWDSDEAELIEAGSLADIERIVFNLDFSQLELASGRWIRLVMGERWDMIHDRSVSLDDIMDPIEEWAGKQN